MSTVDIVGPPSNNDDWFNRDFHNNKYQQAWVQ